MSLCSFPENTVHDRSSYCISSNLIAGGDYYFFRTKRQRLLEGRRLFEEGDYFKYCSLEVVPQIFCFIKLNVDF